MVIGCTKLNACLRGVSQYYGHQKIIISLLLNHLELKFGTFSENHVSDDDHVENVYLVYLIVYFDHIIHVGLSGARGHSFTACNTTPPEKSKMAARWP